MVGCLRVSGIDLFERVNHLIVVDTAEARQAGAEHRLQTEDVPPSPPVSTTPLQHCDVSAETVSP